MPSPMTIRVTTSEANVSEALDLIRRVRLFAEEMRAAGLDVTVDGDLTVVVRTKPGPMEVVTPVGDVSPEEAHRLARQHAAKVAGVEAADA